MAPNIERIADLLHQRIGLNIASVGVSALEYALRSRMKATGTGDLEEYGAKLALTNELQALIETIVVPETWFFRHEETFAALAELVMRQWLPQNHHGRLHLLSIPCSTGEEPYSIAMTLLEAGLPASRLSINAVDISAQSLGQAREGLYRDYSFRNRDTSLQSRYFSREGNKHRLTPEVRSLVNFHEGNILTLDFLPLEPTYDIIFCRNLLIYLHTDSRGTAISNLTRRLKRGGWLFTGSAEASFFQGGAFRSTDIPGSSSFQKVERTSTPPLLPNSASITSPFTDSSKRSKISANFPNIRAIPTHPTPPVGGNKPGNSTKISVPVPQTRAPEEYRQSLETIRTLADAGKLDEANNLSEVHFQKYGESAAAFYLLALLKDAGGQYTEAEANYRKVLYLEPNHIEAMHHLASLLAVRGEDDQAARLRERAGRVAKRRG